MKKPNAKLTKSDLEILEKTSDDDLLEIFPNHTRSFLRRQKRLIGKPIPVREQIEYDKTLIKSKKKLSTVDKKYKQLLDMNEELVKKLEAVNNLSGGFSPIRINSSSSHDSEATAVLVASDWHIEEEIKAGTVNGLNEFNLGIGKVRVERFFQNSLKLIKKEKKDCVIKNIVLALLGDFISGNIHDELLETSQLEPIFASILVQNQIAGGIDYLLDNTDCDIIIPCCSGNHSRITKKSRVSTETGNAIETFIYSNLAWHYKNNKRVKFILQEGYFVYLDVYGFILRFHHGHNMRYMGGVGGISIPVNKAINQWNKSKRADIDVFGHWHQKLDGGNYVCNGSLIGYNAFALSIKASCEKPTQTFFLIDKLEGKTIVAPIYLNK